MQKTFITIQKSAEYRFIEKKSEFIGRVYPVKNESDCTSILSEIRKKHYDATHNCFAYVLGENLEIQRSSDDGEPSGTAGLPILDVLRKGGVTNALIIVTRYFGGILLGSGGLIRAYSSAASGSVSAAGLVKCCPSTVYELVCEYSFFEKLKYELPRQGFTLLEVSYGSNVSLQVTSPEDIAGSPEALLSEVTSGSGQIETVGVMTVEIPI